MRFTVWSLLSPRQRPQNSAILLTLSLLAVGLGGCAATRFPGGVSPTATPASTSPASTAQELLGQLESRRHSLTSLRGLARVTYKDANDKGSAKQAIAVAAPDRFRWELFSPIGVAALVTSNGTELATYFPGEKVLYRGAATPENVARFTRVFLSPREIVGLLLGVPVLPATNENCTVRLDVDHNWRQLTCLNAGQEGVALWFETHTSHLRRVDMYGANGSVSKRMELADYRSVGADAFPFEIVLSDLQNQQQASIFYERVELNPHPAEAIFTLAAMNGVREVEAEANPP